MKNTNSICWRHKNCHQFLASGGRNSFCFFDCLLDGKQFKVLESNAIYNAETKTYLYRPRGLYDYGSTYEPYPEVVSYEKMDDGKIKLIINAVWERTMQDNAMTSELVIQPLDNNRFHYISNQVIKSNLDDTSKWYRNRLTYGEWNKIYKENDEIK